MMQAEDERRHADQYREQVRKLRLPWLHRAGQLHLSKYAQNSIVNNRALNNHLMGIRSAKLAALIVSEGSVLKNHPKMSDLSSSVQTNPNPALASVCSSWS